MISASSCTGTRQYARVLTYKHFDGNTDAEFCICSLQSSFRQDQQGLASLVEKELKKVSQQLDKLNRRSQHESHTPLPRDDLKLRTGRARTVITLDLSIMTCAVSLIFDDFDFYGKG